MKNLILRMIHRKLILRSQSHQDTALKSVSYAEFKAISCRLCDAELLLLFEIIGRNFVKTNNYDFFIFLLKKLQKNKIKK